MLHPSVDIVVELDRLIKYAREEERVPIRRIQLTDDFITQLQVRGCLSAGSDQPLQYRDIPVIRMQKGELRLLIEPDLSNLPKG